VTYVPGAQDIQDAIVEYLDELASESKQPHTLTVDVLGRYRFDRAALPQHTPPSLTVTFRTVHSSKGLEADYVVIPNITNSLYGFPSRIADDPVLDVVMAEPDDFPYAEERRLFYVALTRAKRDVMMFAVRGQESPFLVELINNGLVEVLDSDAEVGEAPEVCPACGQGVLRPRTGPYGDFLGCSAFPRCRYTRNRL
jgi:DNA helicase-4